MARCARPARRSACSPRFRPTPRSRIIGPHLVLPGFIDPHIHFPQTQVIASYGAQLLEWLNKYTFVEEQKFADPGHCAANARFFFDELLRNGTTTAVAFCSVHPQSAEAFFAESERRGTLMLGGKVMMDRNAPEGLRDTAQRGYDETKALIGKWHGRGRQLYAIAPRFAITSSPAQLEAAGALVREHADCHVETHLSENHAEIAQVRELFPEARDYTDVYDRNGLLGPKTLLGHCIHLSRARARRDRRKEERRGLLPDLESVHRLGAVRLARHARGRHAHRSRDRCREAAPATPC